MYYSIEGQIHETVHKAFWNSLKEDFEKNPIEYKHALILINDAKQVTKLENFWHRFFDILKIL